MRSSLRKRNYLLFPALFSALFIGGCSVQAKDTALEITKPPSAAEKFTAGPSSTIEITPNSPADTVRVFYMHLREGRFREAIFLTNLRPAIEGLTDSELKEFQVDFEAIGRHVPPEIEINGEIVSGNLAAVTAKLPGEDLDRLEIQEIRLRKDGDVWVILTVDEEAEALIKKEGKNYFYALRIETLHDEAREMMDRIVKAQMAFSVQNQGLYAGIPVLVEGGLLPPDIRSSSSTGYNYTVTVSDDRKSYSASATPAVYGKTGKLSFAIELGPNGTPTLTSRDAGEAKR